MRVEAYYNLHKHCISARPIGGKVKHYAWVNMRDVTFAVQPAGRLKVQREGKKNVHAFVRGELDSHSVMDENTEAEEMSNIFALDHYYDEVTYNPYKYYSFVRKATGEPIYNADNVWIVGKRIFASKENLQK